MGRVLRNEVDVASLLGFLAARDPCPLQQFLDLPEPIRNVRVEVQFANTSRLDVVLDGGRGPIAVLELKVSATEHGDQLARYEQFASRYGAAKYLADLELPESSSPNGWTRVGLAELFGCWVGSADATTNVFSTEISNVFRQWHKQALGPLSSMDRAMFPIVLRSVSAALCREGFSAYATGTSAGQPSLVVFKPHPSGMDRAYLCVDIRCQNKNDPAVPWLFRIGVHVDEGDHLPSDRRLAHELASQLESALNLVDLRAGVSHIASDHVVEAISGARPLKAPRNHRSAITRWLEGVDEAGNGAVFRHPVFHHDKGRRLCAQFSLDTSKVSSSDIHALAQATLTYLSEKSR